MKKRIWAAGLIAVAAACVFVAGPAYAATAVPLVPSSYVTLTGADGGQDADVLEASNQTGTTSNPAESLTLLTPDKAKYQGYIERQVTGWTERYAKSQTDDIPAVTEIARWLAANKPADGAPSLIHNDFKFDNVIFDPSLSAITGVLDWEMTTIGDPLMDLGTSLSYWAQASDPPAYHQLPFGPTARPGMMTRMGGFCASMVLICTGEVCVRSNSREPSGFGGK